jgi:hypothetical protein
MSAFPRPARVAADLHQLADLPSLVNAAVDLAD